MEKLKKESTQRKARLVLCPKSFLTDLKVEETSSGKSCNTANTVGMTEALNVLKRREVHSLVAGTSCFSL